MIKTIIFDIGNVLTDYRWKGFFDQFGYTEEVLRRITNATVKSAAWNEYDRGLMSDEEVLAAFIKNDPEIGPQIKESLENVNGLVAKLPYAIPWVKELKARGYQVLVLSNFSAKAWRECADALDFMEYVDGGILSYKEGLIKPQPEIYRLLLTRYGLLPEESVFIDDLQINVEAARKEGINGIVFESESQAKAALEQLLADA